MFGSRRFTGFTPYYRFSYGFFKREKPSEIQQAQELTTNIINKKAGRSSAQYKKEIKLRRK